MRQLLLLYGSFYCATIKDGKSIFFLLKTSHNCIVPAKSPFKEILFHGGVMSESEDEQSSPNG